MPTVVSLYHHQCPQGTPDPVEPREVEWKDGRMDIRKGWYMQGKRVKFCPRCAEELREPK